MNKWLLKTTKISTATVSEEVFFDTENLTDSICTEITGYIVSVDSDTMKQKLMCPKCKCIVNLNKIVICSSYNTMTTLDCCKKKKKKKR